MAAMVCWYPNVLKLSPVSQTHYEVPADEKDLAEAKMI
jgi:hypothetical protein